MVGFNASLLDEELSNSKNKLTDYCHYLGGLVLGKKKLLVNRKNEISQSISFSW
jgi:hypothetical protein